MDEMYNEFFFQSAVLTMNHFLAAKFHQNFANVTAPKEYAF